MISQGSLLFEFKISFGQVLSNTKTRSENIPEIEMQLDRDVHREIPDDRKAMLIEVFYGSDNSAGCSGAN